MKPRNRILAALAVFVLLPAAAVTVAALRFDPDSLRAPLAAAVRDATGRELRIAGPLSVRWAFSPTIEATGVSLDNIAGGSRPDIAHADRVAVTLGLTALLRRRIEIAELRLTGPNILFETVDGRPNWRFDIAPKPADPAAPTWSLAVRDAHVVNGMVTWRLPARTKVVGIRAMDVHQGSDHGPIEWDGTFVYGDNAPFRLSGSALPSEAGPGATAAAWHTRLDLTAPGPTEASATGTMDTAGTYDLQVEARADNLATLNTLYPEMRLPALRAMQLSARIGNGKRPGDVPVIGATTLRFAALDPASPGALRLGPTTLAATGPGAPATVETGGVFRSQAFTLSGTTAIPRDPDAATALPLDLRVRLAGRARPATAAADVTIKGRALLDHLDYAGLDATVGLRTPTLATLRPLLGDGIPALTDVDFAAHLALPASPDAVPFTAMRLRSAQGDLAGAGRLALSTPSVDLSGRFSAAALDLDAALSAFGVDMSPHGPRPPRSATAIPDQDLAWPLLRGPRVAITLDAAGLAFLGETWRGIALDLDLANGQLRRAILSVAAGTAPVRFSLTADANDPALPAALAIDAPALPLSLVARYAGLPGRVSGTAAVTARLHGQGRTLHDLAATLRGTVSLANRGGRIANAATVALLGPALDSLGITVPAAGDTAITCLGVAATFANGIGRVSPIALQSTYLALAGEGMVDLRRETLDFDLKPFATVSGSTVPVPVKLSGPFGNVSGRLDADLVDKLGLFLDGLFGGSAPTACADAGLGPTR